MIDISTVRSVNELPGRLQLHIKSTLHVAAFGLLWRRIWLESAELNNLNLTMVLYCSGNFLREILNNPNYSTLQNEQNILEQLEGQLQRYPKVSQIVHHTDVRRSIKIVT